MRFRIIPIVVIPIFLFTFWYYGLHFWDFSSQFSNSTWLQSRDLVLLPRPKISSEVQPFYNKWKDCVNKALERVSEDPVKVSLFFKKSYFHRFFFQFWFTWFKHINKCEEVWSKQLEIRGFRNLDETKYHVLPLNVSRVCFKMTRLKNYIRCFYEGKEFFLQNEPSVIVTIGIGHDTTAEEKLRLVKFSRKSNPKIN